MPRLHYSFDDFDDFDSFDGFDGFDGFDNFSIKTQAAMSSNALYTDLSGYYDLLCTDIDYQAQSHCVQRLYRLFGSGGINHLDLACGTGPHVRHFIDSGYSSRGLDISLPMLERAKARCPQAQFSLGDMCDFQTDEALDLITCFLYSIHYSGSIERLHNCLGSVQRALQSGGVFCFNAVDKHKIDNNLRVTHSTTHNDSQFTFSSAWHYGGTGNQQALKLGIQKTTAEVSQLWSDEHPMVAVSFEELTKILQCYFDVHIFEHEYEKIVPWDGVSGNAIFVCVKA